MGAGGRFICRRLEAKARKHNHIRVLPESKLNTMADRISTTLTDDKISEEEFRLILSEVDKYDQMKAEIRRGHQKEGGEKKQLLRLMRGDANGPYQAVAKAQQSWNRWHLPINISCSRA